MTFKKYQTANNSSGFLEASIAPTGDTLIIQTAYADLFPAHNGTTDKDYQLTLEHFIDNKVTKREIVLVKSKVGNVFTVEKANGYCPASRDATTQTNTAFGFSAGDLVELRETSENDKDIKDEIDRKLYISEYQEGKYVYGASSTGNDDYSITLPYGPSAYTVGQIFRFQADTTNVGTATINVNGLGVKTIKKQHDRALEGGDIEAGQIVTVCYDGTNMQMDSQVATIPTVDIHGQDEKLHGDPDDEFITYDIETSGNKKIKAKNIALSAFVVKSDYPLGEPITDITKSCVFKETAPTFAQANTAQNVADVVGNTRVSFPAIGTGVAGNSLKLSLAKVLSPTAFLRVRLETDNAGSPSGTLVDAGYTTYTQDNGFSASATTSGLYSGLGYRILANVACNIKSVRKVAGDEATRCLIKSDTGNTILATATFIGDVATFSIPYSLSSGTHYRIEGDNNGLTWTSRRVPAPIFPVNLTNINYVGGSVNGGNITIGYCIDNIDVEFSTGNATKDIDPATLVDNSVYTNAHGLSLTGNGNTNSAGVKITTKKKLTNIVVTKFSSTASPTCRLFTSGGTLIETVSFSGNTATFTSILDALTSYRIECYNGGTSYYGYANGSPGFPKTGINLDFTTGSIGLSDNPQMYDIVSIASQEWAPEVTVTLPGSFTVANGTKVHTVVSAVGDVVNASNYYKIGHSNNDTSTRALSKRNTTRGTATSTIFPYISSTLFHNTVLSLTDSDFAHKVDLYGIATATGAVGSYPKLYIDGVVPNFTGMTEGVEQYLDSTPGGISSTAGTNKNNIGVSKGINKLYLSQRYELSGATSIVASDTLRVSADTERTTTSTSYTLVKDIDFTNLLAAGTIRVKFDIAEYNTVGYGLRGRIYKNGSAVGTERVVTGGTYVKFSEDISVAPGDNIQLYIKAAPPYYIKARNFRIYYDKRTVNLYTIVTN